MKRYVIFAVIMLLGLNSCVVDYGTDRRPNRDKVLLVNQVKIHLLMALNSCRMLCMPMPIFRQMSRR